MIYRSQQAWKDIQKFLPEKLHFNANFMPNEEWWDWKGNNVHLDTFRNPAAKAKIILFHGVGTNGRQMSMILGGTLAKNGYEVIAIDMPLYGVTEVNKKLLVTYNDWVQLGNDYIDYELSKDNRPIILYGLSAGGMETYHIACKNKKVKGIIGMTFLNQREQIVRNETTNNIFWAYCGVPLASIVSALGFGRFKISMALCSKMSALCNNPECLKIMLKDKTSGGNSVPMKFIDTYMNYVPEIEPENFDICPILLTQPDKDRWTPLHLSTMFLDKIKKVPVTIKTLENGGHYPIEEKALKQLQEYVLEFIKQVI